MKLKSNYKLMLKNILKLTPFYPVGIGSYIRNLYLLEYIKKLPINKFNNVLDAGCGDGNYSKWISKQYPFLKVNGYDIKEYNSWVNKPTNVFFKKKNLIFLGEKNIYDFCICIDVLNVMPQNTIALSNIYKSLKKGGYFYIHIPIRTQKRILFKKYFKKYDSLFNKKYPGQSYSQNELEYIIESLGFKIIEIYNTFGFFGKIAWEIDVLIGNKLLLKICLMPFLKILSIFELILKKDDTNGIIILSKK